VASRQPLAALEPAKALTQLSPCTAVASRDKDSVGGPATQVSAGRTEGGLAAASGQFVLSSERVRALCSSGSVCCVWTRGVIGRR
jgi:hypothetical protein